MVDGAEGLRHAHRGVEIGPEGEDEVAAFVDGHDWDRDPVLAHRLVLYERVHTVIQPCPSLFGPWVRHPLLRTYAPKVVKPPVATVLKQRLDSLRNGSPTNHTTHVNAG